MNKKNIFWIILILINTTTVSSQLDLIDIQPYDAVLSQGEVYQAEITLNNPVTELKKQNIKFYNSENISKSISPFLTELENNHYFLYFEIPISYDDGDYTLRIEDQSFLVNNVLQVHEEEDPIIIKNSQPSVKITPGLMQLENGVGSFDIYAESKDIQTTIYFTVPSYISHPYVTEQTLKPNVQRKFTFNYNTNQKSSGEMVLTYGSKPFNLPLFFNDAQEQSQIDQPEENITEQPSTEENIDFLVDGASLNKILKKSESLEGNLKMNNLLNRSLSNVKISTDGNIDDVLVINPLTIDQVAPKIEFSIFLSINKNKDTLPGIYTGSIIVSESFTAKLPVTITITEDSKETPLVIEDQVNLDISTETDQDENTSEVTEDLVPWDLSGGYEEETNQAAKPLVTLITILLVVAILIFLLSQKKTTKKRSFSKLVEESKR